MTESVAITETARMSTCLEHLDELGAQVSIDDFGTGHASLENLHRFPFSELKIDKQAIDDCISNPSAGIRVQSIIRLAHNLKKKVVAEGVETEKTLRQLRAWSCDIAQGFLISRSMLPKQVRSWLREYKYETEDPIGSSVGLY